MSGELSLRRETSKAARRAEGRFFDRIVYSSSNEDGASERAALRIGPADSVLAVLGSGARAFELLMNPVGELEAIDQNVHQCALAHLKVAAYQLDYRDFALVLGLRDGGARGRVRLYREGLRGRLAAPWRDYWDAHETLIAGRVIYCGTWESYFRWFARAARTKGSALEALFAAPDLWAQQEIWRSSWCDWRWRAGLWAFGRRATWKYLLREPGIERIAPDFDITAHLAGTFDRCAERHLFRETPYLHLLFRGEYPPEGPFPDHLSEAGFERVRTRLDRLRIVNASLSTHMEEREGAFDAFSLSDVSSYASPEEHARIWSALLHTARPGARVCERYFLAAGAGDDAASARFVRDRALEAQLEEQDDTFIYRFRCGEIQIP